MTWEDGPPVTKTMAHSTAADVEAGRTTWWEKRGNDLADKYAKRGADAHGDVSACGRVIAGLSAVLREAASWSGWQEKAMTKRGWSDSVHMPPGADPSARRPTWQLPAWRGPLPLDVIADHLSIHPMATIFGHRLRLLRMNGGTQLLACMACGAYAGSSPRHLFEPCLGKKAGPGFARQRARMLRGLHPHSSHGQGATIAASTYPSPAQIAWLVADLHRQPAGRKQQAPVAGAMGLDETFTRYGQRKLGDRTAWQLRAAETPDTASTSTTFGIGF